MRPDNGPRWRGEISKDTSRNEVRARPLSFAINPHTKETTMGQNDQNQQNQGGQQQQGGQNQKPGQQQQQGGQQGGQQGNQQDQKR